MAKNSQPGKWEVLTYYPVSPLDPAFVEMAK